MAHRFEKGKSIYFLFKNGHTVQDSQLKPRYYLEHKKAEEYLPYGDEVVEYAPVKRGRWIGSEYDGYADGNPVYDLWECSECGEELGGDDVPDMNPYCPNCGAKMDGE